MRLNLQFANLPYEKRLDTFDFHEHPSIDKRLIQELATGRFLHEGRNEVFLGGPVAAKRFLTEGGQFQMRAKVSVLNER